MSIKRGIEKNEKGARKFKGRRSSLFAGDLVSKALIGVAISAAPIAIGAIGAAIGMIGAQIVYDGQLSNAVNEDFIAATGLTMDESSKCYKKTENGKDYLVVNVVAKDGTVWSMVWEATGYDYNPSKLYSAKDAAKIVESEDPISVERYGYNQEM